MRILVGYLSLLSVPAALENPRMMHPFVGMRRPQKRWSKNSLGA